MNKRGAQEGPAPGSSLAPGTGLSWNSLRPFSVALLSRAARSVMGAHACTGQSPSSTGKGGALHDETDLSLLLFRSSVQVQAAQSLPGAGARARMSTLAGTRAPQAAPNACASQAGRGRALTA